MSNPFNISHTFVSDGTGEAGNLVFQPTMPMQAGRGMDTFYRHDGPHEMLKAIAMRLRLPEAVAHFEHVHAFKVNDEKAAVIVVQNGEVITIEDKWELFPSDELITKLRLIAKPRR